MIDLRHLPNPIPDERLVFFLRRHPITILPLFLIMMILLAAPFFTWGALWLLRPTLLDNPSFGIPFVLGGSIFFLFAWLFLFQYFMDYYLDMWIVTSRRIINIEQTGLFSRTVSELHLYRVQDVTATINGMVGTLLNYGNVEIQTAGEERHFLFEQVHRPNDIAKSVLELSEVDRKEHLAEAVEDFGMPDPKKTS